MYRQAYDWLNADPEIANMLWRYLRQQWPHLSGRTRIEFTERRQLVMETFDAQQLAHWQDDYASPVAMPARRETIELKEFGSRIPPKNFRPAPIAPMGWRSWWRELFPSWREDVDDPEIRWRYGKRVHQRIGQLPRLALDTLNGRLKQTWTAYHEARGKWEYDYRAAFREGYVRCGYHDDTDRLFVYRR